MNFCMQALSFELRALNVLLYAFIPRFKLLKLCRYNHTYIYIKDFLNKEKIQLEKGRTPNVLSSLQGHVTQKLYNLLEVKYVQL